MRAAAHVYPPNGAEFRKPISFEDVGVINMPVYDHSITVLSCAIKTNLIVDGNSAGYFLLGEQELGRNDRIDGLQLYIFESLRKQNIIRKTGVVSVASDNGGWRRAIVLDGDINSAAALHYSGNRAITRNITTGDGDIRGANVRPQLPDTGVTTYQKLEPLEYSIEKNKYNHHNFENAPWFVGAGVSFFICVIMVI